MSNTTPSSAFKEGEKKQKKGYRVDLDKIEEGYLYSEHTCSAMSRNEARKELLRTFDGCLKGEKTEVNYLTIPVVRYREMDEVYFEGEMISKSFLNRMLEKRKRLDKLNGFLSDPKIKFMYIKKNGAYYMSNDCGYTDFVTNAGVYTKEGAVSRAKGCKDLYLYPIDIEKHNNNILEKIEDLKTRIITT